VLQMLRMLLAGRCRDSLFRSTCSRHSVAALDAHCAVRCSQSNIQWVAPCIMQVKVEESGSMTSQLSVSTFYGLIKLLATCAAGSHVVAESLLQVRASVLSLLCASFQCMLLNVTPGPRD
jgi:hypothetical protein